MYQHMLNHQAIHRGWYFSLPEKVEKNSVKVICCFTDVMEDCKLVLGIRTWGINKMFTRATLCLVLPLRDRNV